MKEPKSFDLTYLIGRCAESHDAASVAIEAGDRRHTPIERGLSSPQEFAIWRPHLDIFGCHLCK
jgi:hypothetical protein